MPNVPDGPRAGEGTNNADIAIVDFYKAPAIIPPSTTMF
jgi:hypothetical protein